MKLHILKKKISTDLLCRAYIYECMYHPLPTYLTVRPSNIEGMGIFAVEPIKKSQNLGISHVYDKFWENGYIRTPLGGFINHSNTPNCEKSKEGRYLYIITITDITENTELTLKYTLYDPSSPRV